MSIAASLARACGTRFVGQVQGTCLFYCAALLIGLLASPAFAQVQPIFQTGDAVVTGYSGVSLLKPPPGADIKDFAIINQQGPSLQVFDMSQMNGPDDARLVKARRLFSVSAKQIGQVFGIALDDGRGRPKGEPKTPNIYATATSAFGLQIVKTENGVRNRAKVGGPNRTWLAGQFGIPAGGGPGVSTRSTAIPVRSACSPMSCSMASPTADRRLAILPSTAGPEGCSSPICRPA